MHDVIFRAAVVNGDARYPVRLEVSVDQGDNWHLVSTRALTVNEHVDEPPTADLEVFLLGHQERYTGEPIPLQTYEIVNHYSPRSGPR